jgi:hypothetical protein
MSELRIRGKVEANQNHVCFNIEDANFETIGAQINVKLQGL